MTDEHAPDARAEPTSDQPADGEPRPAKNTWVHRDGRIRRTRPGTPADDRYAKFDEWEAW